MLELAQLRKISRMKDLAQWWLINRKGNDWRHYDVEGGMKALGLYDPDKVKLVAVEMPPEPENAPKLPPVAEIVETQRRRQARRGRRRRLLHLPQDRADRHGLRSGPHDLRQTAAARSDRADAIANPSADISHGFEGSEVKTKDGLTITGMVLSNGDPLIIKCMGGLVQTVPRTRIASVKPLEPLAHVSAAAD